MQKNRVRPLIWKEDNRRLIPLAEVARELNLPTRKVREYAIAGIIPGAVQFGPRKQWSFERDQLNAWWKKFVLKMNPTGELEAAGEK